MRKISMASLVVALLAFAGCEEEGPPAAPPTPTAKPQTSEARPKEAPKLTGQQLAERVKECAAIHETGDQKRMRECYAPDIEHTAVDSLPPRQYHGPDEVVAQYKEFHDAFSGYKYELAVILVNGMEVVAFGSIHGVHAHEFINLPPTNNKIGVLFGQHVVATPEGKRGKVSLWMDYTNVFAQFGGLPPEDAAQVRPAQESGKWGTTLVAIAKNDQKEKDNLALYDKRIEAFNAHKADDVVALYAEDAVLKDATQKEDRVGADIKKGLEVFYKMSSDVKSTPTWKWAAEDYVASRATVAGTFDGPMPGGKAPTKKPFSLQYLDVVKIENGKIKQHWRFGNSQKFAVDVGLIPPPESRTPNAPAASSAAPKGR
jgi:predicted ester cyclase